MEWSHFETAEWQAFMRYVFPMITNWLYNNITYVWNLDSGKSGVTRSMMHECHIKCSVVFPRAWSVQANAYLTKISCIEGDTRTFTLMNFMNESHFMIYIIYIIYTTTIHTKYILLLLKMSACPQFDEWIRHHLCHVYLISFYLSTYMCVACVGFNPIYDNIIILHYMISF